MLHHIKDKIGLCTITYHFIAVHVCRHSPLHHAKQGRQIVRHVTTITNWRLQPHWLLDGRNWRKTTLCLVGY